MENIFFSGGYEFPLPEDNFTVDVHIIDFEAIDIDSSKAIYFDLPEKFEDIEINLEILINGEHLFIESIFAELDAEAQENICKLISCLAATIFSRFKYHDKDIYNIQE